MNKDLYKLFRNREVLVFRVESTNIVDCAYLMLLPDDIKTLIKILNDDKIENEVFISLSNEKIIIDISHFIKNILQHSLEDYLDVEDYIEYLV